jgi:hypothetical protein
MDTRHSSSALTDPFLPPGYAPPRLVPTSKKAATSRLSSARVTALQLVQTKSPLYPSLLVFYFFMCITASAVHGTKKKKTLSCVAGRDFWLLGDEGHWRISSL